MTPTPENNAVDLDTRRRKLRFRCWHRGIREMDLLLGRFADENLKTMDDSDVTALEQLLEVPDHDLFGWLAGSKAVPGNYDLPILQAIRDFHRANPVAASS